MRNWAKRLLVVARTTPIAFAVVAGISISSVRGQSNPPPEPPLSAQEALDQADNASASGDLQKAFHLTAVAAVAGNNVAQNNLGVMYQLGKGVERDFAAAAHWYGLAVDQGNGSAANNLAGLYAEGLGVPVDLEKAAQLLSIAAAQDVPTARNSLALVQLRIRAQKAGIPDSPGSTAAAAALLGAVGIMARPDTSGNFGDDTGTGGGRMELGTTPSATSSATRPDTSIGCAWGDRALGTCH